MKWGGELHSVRTRTKFLLLPREIGGTIRWLERATWTERRLYGMLGIQWVPIHWGKNNADK